MEKKLTTIISYVNEEELGKIVNYIDEILDKHNNAIVAIYPRRNILERIILKAISKVFFKTNKLVDPEPLAIVMLHNYNVPNVSDSKEMLDFILGNDVETHVISYRKNLGLVKTLRYILGAIKKVNYRPIKFGLVGSSGILVNEGILWLLVVNGVNVKFASPIAIEVSILNNFILNNYWTFKEFRGGFFRKLVKYHIAVALGAITNYITLISLTLILGIHYLLANLLGIFVGYVVNYIISELFVWTKNNI